MSEANGNKLPFKELSKPFLALHRCGCGKQARYYHQAVPYTSEITYSCNALTVCPTYYELESRITVLVAENAALKQGMGGYIDFAEQAFVRRDVHEKIKAENAEIKERIKWVLTACEIDRDARHELESLIESESK